jgi:hypothetical protein
MKNPIMNEVIIMIIQTLIIAFDSFIFLFPSLVLIKLLSIKM